MSSLGQGITRVDARGKVTGETLFPGDLNYPDQAFLQIVFAGRAHARIRAIDIRAAETMDGVLLVLTAKDVPVNEYGLILPDQPVLCGPGSSKPHADRVRFVGDQVALVVAETEAIARAAAAAVAVDYEDLPLVTDPVAAMTAESVVIHPDHETNVFNKYQIRKGDAEAALTAADVVIEAEYRTPAQEHAYLQPEAGVAYIDDEGRVTVEVAGQWTHEDQEQIAHALDLPLDRIRVRYPAIGGAFGGREDMSIQIVLALAALRLHERGIDRPVKTIWSREESIIGHHKRHPFVLRAKWGANRQGKITGARVEIIQDGGAYAYTSTKVLGNATLMCTGPYEIDNVWVDAYSVYTNHIPGGAFRGFGGPQAAFAAECQISKLADALGLDRVEIRARNVLKEGSLLSVDTPLPPGVSLDEVIAACASAAGWQQTVDGWHAPQAASLGKPSASHLKRGLGFACGFKNVGFSFGAPEKCVAILELQGGAGIERVILRHAGAEVGQGAHTVMAQMAAEAVGVPVDRVELDVSDTASSSDSGSASASRMTFMAGNAIRGAAEEALRRWKDEERPAVGNYTYRPPATEMFHPQTGKAYPNFAYGYVAEAALVEVDTESGHVHLLKIVCANDVGKAINRQQVVGQIEGGVVQAAGYTILEDFQQADGQVQTQHLSTYLIPGVLDIPDEVQSIVLEVPDPIGPWGARGMAEMPFIPLAPAVTAAVHAATGIWYDEFPLTPERISRGLQQLP